ncbi:hypothetical protein WKH56_05440 [Priestia sp. SB1]|uniref:Uncharacterized protein n=1 Tax=Priestia aryabhattai TaxID=412384 RepID=A0AAX6NCD2_PRIAR|nr:hypothetical protein [Priestia aryabhattai]MDU9693573.1 hypothetical protein [Priestia aryabhattai]NGY89237.1 hypothetical protein [Priestia megaterium]
MSLDNQNSGTTKANIDEFTIKKFEKHFLERVEDMNSLKVNVTTLQGALDYLQKYSGAVNLSLNTYDSKRKIWISSQPIMFAHINEDTIDNRWYIIEQSGKMQMRISKESSNYYILDRIENDGIHLVFSYTI